MKNGHVVPLLADYIDGLLSPAEAEAVKKHLARCPDCREEHRFLKSYMKKAAGFPSVPVPDDFLEKIHARIDVPAPSGMLRRLFFPLKVKLPLEAGGALALAVLAVFIFRPFDERKLEYHAEAPVLEEKAAAPAKEAGAQDRTGGKSLAREYEKERKEKAVTGKKAPGGPGRITVANSAESLKTAPAEERPAGEASAEISLVLKAARAEGVSGAGDEREAASPTLRQKDAYSTRSDMAASEPSRVAESQAKDRDRAGGIAKLATSLGGRVITVSDSDTYGPRRMIIVEIPAKNYTQFLAGIRYDWSIRSRVPAAPPAKAALLRITMSLED